MLVVEPLAALAGAQMHALGMPALGNLLLGSHHAVCKPLKVIYTCSEQRHADTSYYLGVCAVRDIARKEVR